MTSDAFEEELMRMGHPSFSGVRMNGRWKFRITMTLPDPKMGSVMATDPEGIATVSADGDGATLAAAQVTALSALRIEIDKYRRIAAASGVIA